MHRLAAPSARLATLLAVTVLAVTLLAGCPELPTTTGGPGTSDQTGSGPGDGVADATVFGVPPDRGIIARRLIGDVGLMGPADGDYVVSAVEIAGVEVRYTVLRRDDLPDGPAAGTLILEPAPMGPADAPRTASFAIRRQFPAGPPEVAALLDRLAASVTAHDAGGFYVIDPSLRVDAARTTWSARADPATAPPLHRSSTGIAILLAAALLLLLIDLPAALSDLGLRGARWRQNLAWLIAITAAGALARVVLPATFIREAHPLLCIPLHPDAPLLGVPIDLYPQGPQLMAAALSPLLPADPYAAWFIANKILGALGIPAIFALATAATRSPRAGLVAAALLAAWPQHLRVTASESVHVSLMWWATIGFAWTLLAARTGRARALAAAAAALAACLTTRPEGALWAVAVVPAALFAGPGIRTLLRRPTTWILLIALAALVTPMLLAMVSSSSAARFSPGSDSAESVGLGSLGSALIALVTPDGRNAFFDVATTPAWLWPLALAGAFAGWRQGHRAVVASAGIAILGYLALYAHLGPAGTVWPMARYQAAALPAVCLLTTLGLVALAHRSPTLQRHLVPAGATLALAGGLLWSPALRSVEMDWQRELGWWVELSRRPSPVLPSNALVVTPDNRRRFLDLTPRDAVEPLTRGRQHSGQAWTVAHALEHLDPERERRPAYFYAGLYCWLAVGPGERYNPQCAAMKEAFELEPVERLEITDGVYLAAYAGVRAPAPLELTLYRVGARRLDPGAALRLLPPAIEPGDTGHVLPMGAGAASQTDPPEPLDRAGP